MLLVVGNFKLLVKCNDVFKIVVYIVEDLNEYCNSLVYGYFIFFGDGLMLLFMKNLVWYDIKWNKFVGDVYIDELF